MTETATSRLVDPVGLVGIESRIFIDTNVFMDTDTRREGGLRRFFERTAPWIQEYNRPVIVPTKVMDELTRKSKSGAPGLDTAAQGKAVNALVFLRAAEDAGFVRNDLGDGTNPYADDLFVNLFEAYSTKYEMCLITNDITLLLRINLLAHRSPRRIMAGSLTADGLLECEEPRTLHGRGQRKLHGISRRTESGQASRQDHLELASLQTVLTEYGEAFDITAAAPPPPQRPGPVRSQGRPVPSARPAPFAADAAFKGADQKRHVSAVPGEGDTVRVLSPDGGTELVLLDKLGEGGEGSVYAVSGDQVIKIFDKDHITRHREEKIKLFASRQFHAPGICLPQALVTDLGGAFVGYLMPKAGGREFSKALFNPRRFRKEFPHWTKLDLVDVAISFLEKIDYLHSQNILLGDINAKNLLVDAEKNVWIIDADSWQIEGYPCPVGTDMYSAPSVVGKHFPDFLRTIEDERFAVATMLFMILITGQFPYARAGADSEIPALIKEGNFAFQFNGPSNRDQPAGNWRFMWSHLQAPLKSLFWNTFHREGSRYGNRPTDQEWLTAFRTYKKHLTSPANFDPMSNDVYPTRYKAMAPETPLYECSDCGTSMAAIYNDTTKTYATPAQCHKCRSALPRCAECGRHKSSLKDGRCYDCNQGACSACRRGVPKRYLVGGLCNICQPVPCRECGTGVQKTELTLGRCASCQRKRDAERAARRKASETLDPARHCSRCGALFITQGNVEWHQRNSKPVPTSHKRDDSSCRPPVRTTSSPARKKPSTATKQSDGCYVATAVYGSYDCPEVWVLRRWRDTSLRRSAAGRMFVLLYYAMSPAMVSMAGDKSWFVRPTRHLLNRFVASLMNKGHADEPYQDPSTHRDESPSGGRTTDGDSTWRG